jgi:dTDP-4-amino-4,6-dideoxygalactose transaminase
MFEPLAGKGLFRIQALPPYATNNAHTFYIVCNAPDERTGLIEHLKNNGISAAFHYQSLHKSDYYRERHDGRELKNCDTYSDCLVRFPLFYDMGTEEIKRVRDAVAGYYQASGH